MATPSGFDAVESPTQHSDRIDLADLDPSDELDAICLALSKREVGSLHNEIHALGIENHLQLTFLKSKGLLEEYLNFRERATA